MKITVFEGTPEEYKSIANVLGKNTNDLSENAKVTISRKDAYRALLKRAAIYDGQRDMYKVLAKGELQFSEYSKLMKRTPEQLRGVHGALGRRINTTPEIHQAGLPGSLDGVIDWNKGGKNTIGLKPEFLEVLKEEGLI
jgi:hypothetical protein